MPGRFKIIFAIIACIILSYTVKAQSVIWTENFSSSPCAAGCFLNGYGSGWKDTSLGNQGAFANEWYVSYAENGNPVGSCGSGGGGNNTLHVGNVAGSPESSVICSGGDCGAIYDFGGTTSTKTRKIAESPFINCTDFKNITLTFNYLANGKVPVDKFWLWWFDGTKWDSILPAPPASVNTTVCSPPHQGVWTTFSQALPAGANLLPDLRVGFCWQNDNDGSGNEPSVAIDSIKVIGDFILSPIASYTPEQNNFCQNTCISFTDNSTNFPTSWSWSFPGGTPGTSTAENPSNICFNTPGSYFVVLTATNANGSDTAGMTIVVNPCTQPKALFSTQPTAPFCYGDCVDFTNLSQNATSYSWDFGGGGTPNTSTTENPTVCFNSVGTFHVVLTATNSNGSDTSGMNITIAECIKADFTTADSSTCSQHCISFTDLSTGNPTAWSWTFSGGNPSTSSQQNPPTICYPTAGTYSVTLTVSNGGGNNSLTKTGYITVKQSPIGTVSNDTSIQYSASVQLQAAGGDTYQWTPSTHLSNAAIDNPVATPSLTTTYTVTITSTANGCSIQKSVVITVIQPQLIFVPNAFSPNGDGVNDIFKVYTSEPIAYGDFRVFDRWGELLFETADLTKGWDGTYKGKALEMGVFVYWYHVVLADGTDLTGKGDVTLLR